MQIQVCAGTMMAQACYWSHQMALFPVRIQMVSVAVNSHSHKFKKKGDQEQVLYLSSLPQLQLYFPLGGVAG